MVEGPPLHYYYYPHNYDSMEDDLPPSPNSTQSDSDNSLSSIEVSPKPIRARSVIQHTPTPTKINDARCCWRSCGILFDSLDQLANHVNKVHAASGPGGLFYCGWEGCNRNNKGFNARYKMLVHVRTHTNEKPHQCYQCDKSFSRAENLKIHSRSHSGEKPYVCPVPGCNKAYSNSSDRFKHTRTHQVEKPYQCKVAGCQKRYTDPSSLRKHVKTFKHQTEVSISEEVVKPEHKCDCTRMCCSKRDVFRLDQEWDGFYSKKSQQSNEIYMDYKEIDDLPLDLSVRKML